MAVLVAVVVSVDLTHKDCGSSATVTKVFSDDCTDPVCKLKKGKTLFSVKFMFSVKLC